MSKIDRSDPETGTDAATFIGPRLYTQAEVDAAVAAEREWCAKLCDSETLIQHGEFGAGWVAGAKACAALIRRA